MGLFRSILRPLLNLYLKTQNVNVDNSSNIDYRIIKEIKSERLYPIIINKSSLGNIQVGKGCRFFDSVCIGNVTLGRFVTLAGPGIKIVGGINGIEIRDFCSIGANTVIQENDHNYLLPTTYFISRNVIRDGTCSIEEKSKGRIVIEEGTWVGSNCVILSGVKIGRGAVIGAGTVVNCDVEPYSIVVGNPARRVKYRFDENTIRYLEETQWWKKTEKELIGMKEFFQTEL